MLQRVNDPLLRRLKRAHGAKYAQGRNPNTLATLKRYRGNGLSRDTWRGSIKMPARGPQLLIDLFAAINAEQMPLATLERKSGVSRKTIGHWRIGRTAGIGNLTAVANALGYDILIRRSEHGMPAGSMRILEDVSERTGITIAAMRGEGRRADIVCARNEAIRRLYSELGLSSPQIGRIFSRDHTTILHALGVTARSRARLGASA